MADCDLCYAEYTGPGKERCGGLWCPDCAEYYDWFHSLTPEQQIEEHRMTDTYEGLGY